MKALVYEGPGVLSLREVPDPVPAEGEVLVRVHGAGICGSDIHAYLGHDERRPSPLILGHELSGVVASGVSSGSRVVINPLVTDEDSLATQLGRENLCVSRQILSMPPREGGFAELVSVPERNLIPVPDEYPLEKAALIEPIACGWHAVRVARQAVIESIEQCQCLVIGGGAIGFGSALVLRALQAGSIKVCDTNEARVQKLSDEGFDAVNNAEEIVSSNNAIDSGFHLIIDGVGSSSSRMLASRVATAGGVIVHIGLSDSDSGLDIRRLTLRGISFIGSYTYTARDFSDTAISVFEGLVGDMNWFRKASLEEGPEIFKSIHAGQIGEPKVVLTP